MKKYIMLLAISLICHDSVAEVIHQDFQTVGDLIANVKKAEPTHVFYDTNGIIVGVTLPPGYSTDRNLHLLSEIKSVKYLLIANFGGVSTNGILALAEYPNLTGLGLVCCRGLVPALPCLTNLQSLELAQNTYRTNDTIYLAKMTNLVALEIAGTFPHSQAEVLRLTNLVNLRELLIVSLDEDINNLDTNIVSKFSKLSNFVVSSDVDRVSKNEVWNKSFVK